MVEGGTNLNKVLFTHLSQKFKVLYDSNSQKGYPFENIGIHLLAFSNVIVGECLSCKTFSNMFSLMF
jgi:hypothetical protein